MTSKKITLNSSLDWEPWIETIEACATERDIWRFIDPSIKKSILPILTKPTKPKSSDVKTKLKDGERVFYSMLTDDEKIMFHELMREYTSKKEIFRDQKSALEDLKSMILNSIHPKLLCHVRECDTVYQMLVNLSNRFILNVHQDKKEEPKLSLDENDASVENSSENSIMTLELLKKCKFETTDIEILPKLSNIKYCHIFDDCQKEVIITYPDGTISQSLKISDVALYKETFLHYGMTGVFLGIPQAFTKALQKCLTSTIKNTFFEDRGVDSDKKYWWTRVGFSDNLLESRCIHVFRENNDKSLIDEKFSSFDELFKETDSSVLVNIECSIRMNSKIPVERKGAESPEDQWRMGLVASNITVIDIVDVPKPVLYQSIKGKIGPRDIASSALIKRLAIRRKNLNLS